MTDSRPGAPTARSCEGIQDAKGGQPLRTGCDPKKARMAIFYPQDTVPGDWQQMICTIPKWGLLCNFLERLPAIPPVQDQFRWSFAVATMRAGHRLPRSSREVLHRRWGRAQPHR